MPSGTAMLLAALAATAVVGLSLRGEYEEDEREARSTGERCAEARLEVAAKAALKREEERKQRQRREDAADQQKPKRARGTKQKQIPIEVLRLISVLC